MDVFVVWKLRHNKVVKVFTTEKAAREFVSGNKDVIYDWRKYELEGELPKDPGPGPEVTGI